MIWPTFCAKIGFPQIPLRFFTWLEVVLVLQNLLKTKLRNLSKVFWYLGHNLAVCTWFSSNFPLLLRMGHYQNLATKWQFKAKLQPLWKDFSDQYHPSNDQGGGPILQNENDGHLPKFAPFLRKSCGNFWNKNSLHKSDR